MKTFAEKVIYFNKNLNYKGSLPSGISIMNPFKEDKSIIPVSSKFYRKFYDDTNPRHIILGINPGRFGAGVTGIPFTDSKRLIDKCKIPYEGKQTHETSSVFVYEVADAFGGAAKFYKKFYINSVCPLGFTAISSKGKEVNYNYYDSKELTEVVTPFIIKSIKQQLAFGIKKDVCFCFGNGKNEKYLRQLNEQEKSFDNVVGLEHPRFIMQYKAKSKKFFIDKYLKALSIKY